MLQNGYTKPHFETLCIYIYLLGIDIAVISICKKIIIPIYVYSVLGPRAVNKPRRLARTLVVTRETQYRAVKNKRTLDLGL